MIDTHCHLTFPQFVDRVDEVMANAAAAGVSQVITIGTSSPDARACQRVANAHPCVWFSAGLHPLHCDDPNDWNELRECARDTRCVAWGELGLDRFHRTPSLEHQRGALHEHLGHIVQWTDQGLAKPIIIHCRDAFDDLIPILKASGLPPARFVFHCFTAGPREMQMLLEFGASVSFTGVATYRNAPALREAIAMVPLERMMVETDAPFLSPEPVRSVRPCEPAFVVHTARAIAVQRGLAATELESILDRNARVFFGLPTPDPAHAAS
ncbi:MAG: TatD family deoxyribonuclease [Planctomycetes bacterium]|nr:TatD family deoxyribonuclease [Planctomycetota bacterium]